MVRFVSCLFILGLVVAPKPALAVAEDCRCDQSHSSLLGLFLFCPKQGPAVARPPKARSISEGIAEGSIRPFFELSVKQADTFSNEPYMQGGRLGLSEPYGRTLGLAYYRSSGRGEYAADANYRLEYGGLMWGGLPDATRISRMYSSLLLGAGRIKAEQAEESDYSRLFAVIEPELGLAINVSSFLQVAVGVSYRYLSKTEVGDLRSQDLRAWSANVHLRLH